MTSRRRAAARWALASGVLSALAGPWRAAAAGDGVNAACDVDEAEAKRVEFRLQREIDAAIDRGVRYLEERQGAGGTWYVDQTPYLTYDVGVTALCGLALRHGGSPRDDPHVLRARDWVMKGIRKVWFEEMDQPNLDTYSAGLAIMFLLEAGVPVSDATLVGTVKMLASGYSVAGWWDYAPPWALARTRAEFRRAGRKLDDPPRGESGNSSTTLYADLGLLWAHLGGMDERGPLALLQQLPGRQWKDGGFFHLPTTRTYAGRTLRYPPPYFGSRSNLLAAWC